MSLSSAPHSIPDGHNMLPTWKAADLLKRDKLEIFPQDRCSWATAILPSPHQATLCDDHRPNMSWTEMFLHSVQTKTQSSQSRLRGSQVRALVRPPSSLNFTVVFLECPRKDKYKFRWVTLGSQSDRAWPVALYACARWRRSVRQSAALHPDRSWKLLTETEYWEHLAPTSLPTDIEGCFTPGQHDLAAA